jgi:5-methylcytosine-specific restriction endonuclease McrA
MTWLRLDDGFDNDPLLLSVARNRADADRVLGILTALMLYCARHLTDGYLPGLVVAEHVRDPLLGKLTAAGLLHPEGTGCECLSHRPWRRPAEYAVHHYLKSNPTRAEHDVARAKAAELRDRELLHAVRCRDGEACRYCGVPVNAYDRKSARGMVYDHVDPALACGASNLVVACRGCNSRKGPRTPEAAGMVLLPEPRAVSGTDPAPVDGSGPDAPTAPARDGTGRASADDAAVVGPAPPRRSSVHPDPYRRTAITGARLEHHAGLPAEEDYPPPPGGL